MSIGEQQFPFYSGRRWINCIKRLRSKRLQRCCLRKSMIDGRDATAILPRTDYTYARTESYLPLSLACPADEEMIPNLKRDRLWRHNSSADTSTSYRHESEESIHRQKTIDLSTASSELRNTPVRAFPVVVNKRPHRPAGRFSCRSILKFLFSVLAIGIIAFGLWRGYERYGDKFDLVAYVRQKASTYMPKAPHFDEKALADLRDELRSEFETELHRLKAFVSSIPTPHCAFRHPVDDSIPTWFANYDNDRTGLLDFAHESMGGKVISVRCTKTYNNLSSGLFQRAIGSPKRVLQANMMPGECWSFKGSYGTVVIRIAAMVYPSAFTYEHISRSISLMKDNAPFEIDVYGWPTAGSNRTFLGKFYFLWNETKLQTFPFNNTDPEFQARFFEFNVLSNWGNPEQTCLYRFRVHGHL